MSLGGERGEGGKNVELGYTNDKRCDVCVDGGWILLIIYATLDIFRAGHETQW